MQEIHINHNITNYRLKQFAIFFLLPLVRFIKHSQSANLKVDKTQDSVESERKKKFQDSM